MSWPAPCCLVGVWLGYRLVNIPRFADFLIAVEAEMNKVSWPSRGELIRSVGGGDFRDLSAGGRVVRLRLDLAVSCSSLIGVRSGVRFVFRVAELVAVVSRPANSRVVKVSHDPDSRDKDHVRPGTRSCRAGKRPAGESPARAESGRAADRVTGRTKAASESVAGGDEDEAADAGDDAEPTGVASEDESPSDAEVDAEADRAARRSRMSEAEENASWYILKVQSNREESIRERCSGA